MPWFQSPEPRIALKKPPPPPRLPRSPPESTPLRESRTVSNLGRGGPGGRVCSGSPASGPRSGSCFAGVAASQQPFLYGSHYSTPGFVVFYLLRESKRQLLFPTQALGGAIDKVKHTRRFFSRLET